MTYKQLYALFPDYVVLMTNRYMYEAKDRCARVLSYLMDYKLTQNKDGTIICAGPDKDKMMAVLRAHHVNYIVSEFGKITVKESFSDNGFEKYKELSAQLPVQTVSSVTKNDSEPGKALIIPPLKTKNTVIPEWLKIGAQVQHKKFGIGNVTSIVEKTVTVQFSGDAGMKNFILPDAIENHYINHFEES